MLTKGKDSPIILNDLKRKLRLRFEHLKSLSTFKWKNNQDLCAIFKNHDERSRKMFNSDIFKEKDQMTSIDHQLYRVIIQILTEFAYIMYS